jgi:hypothetical protein
MTIAASANNSLIQHLLNPQSLYVVHRVAVLTSRSPPVYVATQRQPQNISVLFLQLKKNLLTSSIRLASPIHFPFHTSPSLERNFGAEGRSVGSD